METEFINNLLVIDRNSGDYEGRENVDLDRLNINTRSPKLEELNGATTIYGCVNFNIQRFEEENEENQGIYYIQKYKKVLTREQLSDFLKEHPDEIFVLMRNSCADRLTFWTYVVSEMNQTTLHLFNSIDGDGILKKAIILRNKFGTVEWDEPEIIDKRISIVIQHEGEDYYNAEQLKNCRQSGYHRFLYKEEYKKYLEAKNDWNRNAVGKTEVRWIGEKGTYSTQQILRFTLKLPEKTRIICRYNGNDDYAFTSVVNKRGLESTTQRYGIRTEDMFSWKRSLFDETDVFPEADLSPETMQRVTEHLTNVLQNEEDKDKEYDVTYSGKSCMTGYTRADILVLDKPVPRHRRPTYHLISGFKAGDVIDVVDIARGELMIEGVEPVNAYHLFADGKYCRATTRMYTILKETINDVEIDKTSFQQWNSEVSVHPELLKTLTEYGDSFDLPMMRLLNTLPFGETFVEQLIKTGHKQLGYQLATEIGTKADNRNYLCGSLADIFPGCNALGTSPLDVLKLSKPCYNFLMEEWDNEEKISDGKKFAYLIAKYNGIKKFMPDGVFTTMGCKLTNEYLDLVKKGWESITGYGEHTDLLEYPEEIRIIHRMVGKIKKLYDGDPDRTYNAIREYEEIVKVYFILKTAHQNPATELVFIDFGLGMSKEEAMDMLQRREAAANNALENYKAKLDAAKRQVTEDRYAVRRKQVQKLESTKALAKEDADFDGFTVIAPSAIYGLDDTRSIQHEGRELDHCVYRNYSQDIANGKYTVLYLRDAEKPEDGLVTIGITQEGRINQTYTFHDEPISARQAKAIVAWAKSKPGLVTFSTELKTVAPSGWYRGITVPSLPEVKQDWLEKLADVTTVK